MDRKTTFQVLVIRALIALLQMSRINAKSPPSPDFRKYLDDIVDDSRIFINTVTGRNEEWWRTYVSWDPPEE